MSNSTELPGLDKLEALAKAATPGPWQVLTDEHETYAKSYVHKERRIFTAGIDPQLGDIYPVVNSSRGIAAEKGDPPIWMVSMEQENADFIAAANPEQVLALIALARRAQPEGEAPQAVAGADLSLLDLAHLFAESQETGRPIKLSASASGLLLAAMTTAPAGTLSPLCGAQHAESGASDLDAFGKWKAYPLPDLNSDGHFDKDWLHREFVAFKAGRRAALAAQQAAAPGAQALLNAEEMAALHRFQETCQDFDSGGYDVDKNMMKRLAAIGVIESKGFGRYQFTDFGDFVIERAAQLDGGQEGSGHA